MKTPFLVIPPTLQRVVVPKRVLAESQALLAEPGEQGLEAVVLWLGSIVSSVTARVDSAHFPRQLSYRTPVGLAVEIPIEAWTALVLQLPPGRFILAKLHTHPGRAYQSEVDAANPFLCHEGALAITVPDFARLPLADPVEWSVSALRHQRWIELSPAQIQRSILIEDDPA